MTTRALEDQEIKAIFEHVSRSNYQKPVYARFFCWQKHWNMLKCN
jgi:hypothetical protein